jgi:hypothetical protein
MEFRQIGIANVEMNDLLTRSLTYFAKILGSRKAELRDCNGELKGLSESLDSYVGAWYSGKPPIEDTDPRTASYILHCPELHPLPYENLERLIKQRPPYVGLNVGQFLRIVLSMPSTCSFS